MKLKFWPEEVYAQEVHEVVCFQLEDVQQEVHIQFDSKSGGNPIIQIKYKPTKESNTKANKPWIIGKQEKLLLHFILTHAMKMTNGA